MFVRKVLTENGWVQGFGAADPKLALLGENMPVGRGVVR